MSLETLKFRRLRDLWDRNVAWRRVTERVFAQASGLSGVSDAALRKRARELKFQLRSGTPPWRLLPDAYALAIEATERALGLRHYPVQVMGAVALFQGRIVEMQTGEGKTITAVLPAALRALQGRGVHVMTANEYLARRDAAALAPIYERMELSVGCVSAQAGDDQRREAYSRDITYGTASEIGFDFLRDRLKCGAEFQDTARRAVFRDARTDGAVQREQFFALVDEADSILVDDARTPLIIGMEQPVRPATVGLHRWSNRVAETLQPGVDFLFEPKQRQSHLTESGARRVALLAKPDAIDVFDSERIFQFVEKSLTARFGFTRNRDYVIADDEVSIVDEGTGRIMEGRKWQDGLHQAVEAKEHVPVTPTTRSAAKITVQTLFRRYRHLAGMTGTAVQAAGEFRKVYSTPVSTIPTHRRCRRRGYPPRVFHSLEAKYAAVASDARQRIDDGRAVLIGTPSVDASDLLSRFLQTLDIEHVVLNARYHEQEAAIVAQAGQPGRVTVATNMAGRGTDIILHESVARCGGLHVIATEMHTSARIDRQLVGRAARQGDPGSYQFFLSFEDELLRVLSPQQRRRIQAAGKCGPGGELPARWLSLFRRTQRRLERVHAGQRKRLLKHEEHQLRRFHEMGLDPFLELVES